MATAGEGTVNDPPLTAQDKHFQTTPLEKNVREVVT